MTDFEDALTRYFGAYKRQRVDEIVDWFLLPCHVVSDGEPVQPIPLVSREACASAVQRVLDWHRELGVGGSKIVKQVIFELSPRMSCVDVRVDVEDGAGVKLYDFGALYTFAYRDSTWRIAAIAHNQIPRLSSRLEAHRAARAS